MPDRIALERPSSALLPSGGWRIGCPGKAGNGVSLVVPTRSGLVPTRSGLARHHTRLRQVLPDPPPTFYAVSASTRKSPQTPLHPSHQNLTWRLHQHDDYRVRPGILAVPLVRAALPPRTSLHRHAGRPAAAAEQVRLRQWVKRGGDGGLTRAGVVGGWVAERRACSAAEHRVAFFPCWAIHAAPSTH